MRNWNRTASTVAAALLMLLTMHGAFGQSASFATFTGQALDPQGASIPGATVIATNVETAIVRTTQTTSDGLYRLDNLPPGIYDVVIEARSFTRVETKNVKLQVGEQRDINFNLQPAGEKQFRGCNLGGAPDRNYQDRRFFDDKRPGRGQSSDDHVL